MLPTNKPYIIGETAFHHEGDIQFLKELINTGGNIGVDAMKFHLTIDLDDYMIANHEAIDVLRPWCLNAQDWSEVLDYLKQKNIDTILLCNDVASLDWVLNTDFNVKAIELHATGLNDYFLLEKAAIFKGTVILGTGGSTLDEIEFAIDFLKSKGQEDVFLMHGFQNYPTDFKDINLSKMKVLQEIFNLPIGYADHTDPQDEDNECISVLAAAMGFNVLEKHFTHQFGKKRIDAQSAVSVDQMVKIKRLLTKTLSAYGFEDIRMSDAEKKYGNTGPMKKAIVARKNIAKGEQLSIEHIAFKRTNESTYIKQMMMPKLIGLEVAEDIEKDQIIDFSKVNYLYKKADILQFENTNE